MPVYEKLVKLLRYCANADCTECAVAGCHGPQAYLAAAADAIEELNHHYCPHAIRNVHDRGNDSLCEKHKCEVNALPRWIPVTERLPEESEGLNLQEDLMIRFASVWCCDVNTGTINVRNRFQHKKQGFSFFDQNIQDTDWHWSKSWWEPTHWMPRVPLPEPPEEEEND